MGHRSYSRERKAQQQRRRQFNPALRGFHLQTVPGYDGCDAPALHAVVEAVRTTEIQRWWLAGAFAHPLPYRWDLNVQDDATVVLSSNLGCSCDLLAWWNQ